MIIDKRTYLKRNCAFAFTLFLCCILSSCQQTPGQIKKYTYKSLNAEDRGNNKYIGHYKVGNKYKIKNKTYRPREVTRYTQVGMASWYGDRYGFHGNKTANGDFYNKNMLTAAHRTLQLPSLVKVTNLENKKSLIVLVNDRGPYAFSRIIDLSEKAAEILDVKRKGSAKVKVQYLHSETKKFLNTLGLKKKYGSRAKNKLYNERCTVNCHIKLVNLKHRLNIDKPTGIKN
jgi:rare lipoprotein A